MITHTKVTLENVRTLQEKGEAQQAIALARDRDTKAVTDAHLHLRWADLLEEMGLMDGAVVELNLAIRDDPHEESAYKRLAEIYLDQGNPEKAARCRAALMAQKPPGASDYRELGRIWEEAGNYEKALEIYREGEEKTGDDGFKSLIRSLDFVKQEEAEDFAVEKVDQIVPAQHNLVTFTVLFASREGVNARQWASPTGETGYTPIHEPLTLKVAENHILGNMTLGVYPVRMDNTVHFIAFDLDLPKFVINKTIKSKSLWDKAMDKVHRIASATIFCVQGVWETSMCMAWGLSGKRRM